MEAKFSRRASVYSAKHKKVIVVDVEITVDPNKVALALVNKALENKNMKSKAISGGVVVEAKIVE